MISYHDENPKAMSLTPNHHKNTVLAIVLYPLQNLMLESLGNSGAKFPMPTYWTSTVTLVTHWLTMMVSHSYAIYMHTIFPTLIVILYAIEIFVEGIKKIFFFFFFA